MNSKLIRWILGVLGFSTVATSCELIEEIGGGGAVCMYGCPSADYVFNVEVEDVESGAPIEGIRVSAVERGERQYWDSETGIAQYETYTDTLASGLTTADGKVVLRYGTFPRDEHEIVADDIDGAANGDYSSTSVEIKVDKNDYENPGESGWYSGTATNDITMKLSKK